MIIGYGRLHHYLELVNVIDWGTNFWIHPAQVALTLYPRSLSLTIKSRSLDLTLETRSLSLTLKERE